jgi:tRNA splicing endonuclease
MDRVFAKNKSGFKSESSKMGKTNYSMNSKKEKEKKDKEQTQKDVEIAKLATAKILEVSNFDGEPPEPEMLMEILKKKGPELAMLCGED